MIIGFYLISDMALGGVVEPMTVIIITFGGCMVLHEYVIKRVRLLRPLFGLKPLQVPQSTL